MSEMKATRVAYGEALAELGRENDKIVVLDADVSHATMTLTFKNEFPDRFYNMGIAEFNMAGVSAGLSTMGLIPFCSTFAIFGAGRAYEMVRNSIGYPHFNVKLCMSHAGITTGEDGSSHQAFEDLALMREIPGMTVIVPCDANETRRAVRAAAEIDGPVYLRLARQPSHVFEEDMPFEVGKANVLKDGKDGVIFAIGFLVKHALDVAEALKAEGKDIAVVNVHTLKPIDRETVLAMAQKCKNVITMEEHSIIGGLGDAVAGVLIGNGDFKFKKIGIEDRFGMSGKANDLIEAFGFTSPQLTEKVREFLK